MKTNERLTHQWQKLFKAFLPRASAGFIFMDWGFIKKQGCQIRLNNREFV
jgi:hypothetical protein